LNITNTAKQLQGKFLTTKYEYVPWHPPSLPAW